MKLPSISLVFFLPGVIILILASFFLYRHYTPQRLAFNTNKNNVSTNKTSAIQPIKLVIRSTKLDLPIFPATVTNKNWEVTNLGVSHLSTSPVPGEKGNSIIYGHDYTSLLGNLGSVRNGDVIEVFLSDGRVRKFKVVNKMIVSPDQTSVLDQTEEVKLTIFTCTGFLDSMRLVVVSTPTAS